MASSRKVLITCAITGAIHTPSMSPHLPVTAQAIAAEAIAAADAGAALIHLHARDDATGRPDQSVEAFERIVPAIRQRCNAVLNITTGGSPYMSIDERVAPALALRPEIASLNMGSMNLGLFPMLKRQVAFKHDWERTHLENSHDLVFKNTFADIETIVGTLRPLGTRFEFECYDTAHLYTLSHLAGRGIVEPPFFIQTVFGLLGGIGAHGDDVAHMKRTADRLFGSTYVWSVLGAGQAQMRIAAMSVAMGGHVRVGLEDSLWAGPGQLAVSNAEQVKTARTMIEAMGCGLASAEDARHMLHLKGR